MEFLPLPKDLSGILEQLNLPKPPIPTVHKFSTKDSRRFISLSQDFLALTEQAYVRWEAFRREIQIAENALREVYEPAFYSRIGLRYRNVISRGNLGLDGAKWKDLLKPHIVAELGDNEVSGAILMIQTQSIIRTPEVPGGQVRLIHGLTKPAGSNEECYVIDADFAVEQKEGLNEPFGVLDKFNRLVGRLFRWAITDTLHNALEPEAIQPS